MPIQLSQLKANTRTIVVPYYEDTVTITYRPSALTPERESEIMAGAKDGDNLPMLQAMADLIIAWDVEESKDKPLPITVEVLGGLMSAFVRALYDAIREDMAPKARRARSSFGR